MPNIDRHSPGTFNWFELATSDQAAAKNFYNKLFGWSAEDSPMGSGGTYSIFKLDGLDVAGGYTLRPDMVQQGIPPHWDIYIAVESADDTAAAIESFGGKLMCQPFDVMTHGRMAVAADPTGAVFCIWQPYSHIGARSKGDGAVCWADLATADPEAASQFYSGVFGWQVYQAPNDSSGYLHIKNQENHIGGISPALPAPSDIPPHWMLYFATPDLEITTNKAGALGANTLVPVTDIPNTGKFSVVRDPQGAVFALFQAGQHQ